MVSSGYMLERHEDLAWWQIRWLVAHLLAEELVLVAGRWRFSQHYIDICFDIFRLQCNTSSL